jgi:transposase InsO family protein
VDVEDEEKRRLKSVLASVSVNNELLGEKIARLENGSGSRRHEPHHFAFQPQAIRCGAGGLALAPGAVQLLRRAPAPAAAAGTAQRGPKVHSDEELLAAMRQLLAEPVFTGEGYRKIWARLRHQGIRTSKDRVLRLLREHQLLSPSRQPEPVRHHPHEGTIVSDAPNQMWGTDATATLTEAEGAVTVFAAIDHCTAECVGIHAVKKATRFEALEPIRQAVKEYCYGFSAGSAAGLRLRHGSVYMSADFQREIQFLGIAPSPAFVRQPQGQRMHRTFLPYAKGTTAVASPHPDLEELRAALTEFRDRYNQHWMILERLGYRTPAQARRDFDIAFVVAA